MPTYVLNPRRPVFEQDLDWEGAFEQVSFLRLRGVKALLDLYVHPDARYIALFNVGSVLAAAAMILNILKNGSRSEPEAVMLLFGISGPVEDLQSAVDSLERFTRLGVVSQTQFHVESMLSNLLRADGVTPNRGFAALARQALAHFDYPSVGRGVRVLMVPAHIRNSLHNNGIHANPDVTVQINGYRYWFRQGRECRVAGWGHIVHVIRAELRVIERLLLTPTVRALTYVAEPYAVATGLVPP